MASWGIPGTRPGQFQHPGDVAVDPETLLVYVSDIENARIQKFDNNGSYISEWGSFGTGDGQFNHPGDIDIGTSESILFVTDIGNHRRVSLLIILEMEKPKEYSLVKSMLLRKTRFMVA